MQPAPGALRSGISKVDGAESASAVPVSSVGSHICAPVLTLKKHSVPWHIRNLRWGMMYAVVENLGRGNEEAHGACFIANLYGGYRMDKVIPRVCNLPNLVRDPLHAVKVAPQSIRRFFRLPPSFFAPPSL